jgi:hypothetical protein
LIQKRTVSFRTNSTQVENAGYWFHYLEDKIAGYLLSVSQRLPAPKVYCCLTDAVELYECLSSSVPRGVDGLVIKATNFHSSQGVFVLVNEPGGNANLTLGFNLLENITMSSADVVSSLSHMQATKIIVEEFIGSALPTEYKFHVINGSVAAIDIIDKRGTDCACYAVVDTDWNRLDTYGCFEPGGLELMDEAGSCNMIDFASGKLRAGPVKKDLNICDEISKVPDCIMQDMINIALSLGKKIGVAIRVDMFVAKNKVYVQEYSANHMNGLRHCAARVTEEGCIDSCYLGRMWDAAGGPYGGMPTTVPAELVGFVNLTPKQQCDLLSGVKDYSSNYRSTCTMAG